MENFEVIYDFGIVEIIKKSWYVITPLFFYAIAIVVLRTFDRDDKIGGSADRPKYRIMKYGSLIIFIFLALIEASKIHEIYGVYSQDKIEVVEGHVEEFHAMPATGHDYEQFKIGEVKFKFSDYDVTNYGYNNAKSKGGVVDSNRYLRIRYYSTKNTNVILRIEKLKQEGIQTDN